MQTKKYFLSVGDCGGGLQELAPRLRALNLQVVRAKTIHKALALAKRFSLLSLVIIEQRAGAELAPTLVNAIRDANSDLPIIWIAQAGSTTVFSETKPDVCLQEPVDVDELRSHADRLLCQHFYPDALVDKLAASVTQVLQDTFGVDAECHDRIIRANRTILSEVNAVITFCGDEIAGRMVISGAIDDFRAIFQSIAGSESHITRDDAADACGEICNQALGNFKPYLEASGQAFELTPPILILGQDADIRFKASRPALVLRFDNLFVEFCFDTVNPDSLADAEQDFTDADAVESGDLTFF